MTASLVLSIDAMGGDHAPESVIDGAAHFLKGRRRSVNFLMHGDEARLAPLLERHAELSPLAQSVVRMLGDEAGWRQNAELVFALDQGLQVGYRGFYDCAAD